MKSTSITRFNHLLLSIAFNEDLFSSQFDILHLSSLHNNKGYHKKTKKKSKQRFASTFTPFTKTIMVLVYWSTILVHFPMLAPMS